jgi:hypothetical protein
MSRATETALVGSSRTCAVPSTCHLIHSLVGCSSRTPMLVVCARNTTYSNQKN